MNNTQWEIFCGFKEQFLQRVKEWSSLGGELTELQRAAAKRTGTPEYPLETAVVYNRDLDSVTRESDIRLIVIGDNPGKDEQLEKNNRYLVGQAGKLADGFFRKNTELGIDFRKNVIILNKTPVHSAKTAQLRLMMKEGGQKICSLIEESQLWMAQSTARLHSELCAAGNSAQPELWLVGYSELKPRGIFVPYKEALKKFDSEWSSVFVFQHFSMNRFFIDLKEFSQENGLEQPLVQTLHSLGELHKSEIYG